MDITENHLANSQKLDYNNHLANSQKLDYNQEPTALSSSEVLAITAHNKGKIPTVSLRSYLAERRWGSSCRRAPPPLRPTPRRLYPAAASPRPPSADELSATDEKENIVLTSTCRI